MRRKPNTPLSNVANSSSPNNLNSESAKHACLDRKILTKPPLPAEVMHDLQQWSEDEVNINKRELEKQRRLRIREHLNKNTKTVDGKIFTYTPQTAWVQTFGKQPRLLRNSDAAFVPNPLIYGPCRPSRLSDYVAYNIHAQIRTMSTFFRHREPYCSPASNVQTRRNDWPSKETNPERKYYGTGKNRIVHQSGKQEQQ